MRSGIRYMSFWVTAFVLLLQSPAQICAQTRTLPEILDRIDQNNPGVLSYQNRIKAADEMAKGASAWMPPMASVEWDEAPYGIDASSSQLRLAVSQTLPNASRNKANENYLLSMAVSENYGREYYKVQLYAQAKQSYYKIYVSERRINILEESNKVIDLIIKLAEKQLALAKGDLGTVYRLKGKLVENESMIIHEQNMIRSSIITLNYLMNDDINQNFDIDTLHLMRDYRSSYLSVRINSLDTLRSDVVKMTSEITTMRLQQQYLSYRGKPEFGVRFEHHQQLSDMPNRYSIMGTMTIPSAPWSAKGYKSEVRALDYRISAFEQERMNMLNMAAQSIKMFSVELGSEYAELDNYTEKVIPSYKKALDATLLAYGQTTSDMNMALMAWSDLLMAQMEYIKHLETYFTIQTEYEKQLQIR